MAPKRKAADAETSELKRCRSVIDETAEDLVCAITMSLPLDPVTAMDGHVYERDAVEEQGAYGVWGRGHTHYRSFQSMSVISFSSGMITLI